MTSEEKALEIINNCPKWILKIIKESNDKKSEKSKLKIIKETNNG